MARRSQPRHQAAGEPGEDVRLSLHRRGSVAVIEVHRLKSLRITELFTMPAGDSKLGGVGEWRLAALVISDGCRFLFPSWLSPTITATRHSHMRMEETAVDRDWIDSLSDLAARCCRCVVWTSLHSSETSRAPFDVPGTTSSTPSCPSALRRRKRLPKRCPTTLQHNVALLKRWRRISTRGWPKRRTARACRYAVEEMKGRNL